MRILAIADVHGREDIVYMVQEIYGLWNFDAVVIAGDITNFGPREFAKEFINNLPGHVLAVPGNCDPPEVITAIEESKGMNIHKKTAELGKFKFIGLGGVNGGFNMGITFTDKFAMEFLGRCKRCVFVTHQPPYGVLDEVPGGKHIGSKGIRDAIMVANPPVVISGHVHEARGYRMINDTLVVNPGPARDGYAAIINLDTLNVKMLER